MMGPAYARQFKLITCKRDVRATKDPNILEEQLLPTGIINLQININTRGYHSTSIQQFY